MSAPTPAPGDDRPREGYYPDPSIPGYVRYWNGAAWVPGTSRPAPSGGEPLSSPADERSVPASTEETGPHFFDEDPPAANPSPADAQHGSRPEPATAWGADRSRQTGFGGDPDRRIRWGKPDPRVPAEQQAEPAGPSLPSQPDGRSDHTDGMASFHSYESQADSGSGAESDGGSGALKPPGSGGSVVFRRPTGPVQPTGAAGSAGSEGAGVSDRAAGPAGGAGAAGAMGAGRAHVSGADRSGAVPGSREPLASEGTMTFRAVPRGGQQRGSGASAAQSSAAAQAAAAQAQAAPQGPAAAFPAAPATPQRSAAPQSAPERSTPGTPAQSGSGAPMAAGAGGGQPSWAQQVHRLAGPEADQPVVPWKPVREDPFQAVARSQANARPAGLGKRLAARLVDTVVLAAVTGAAAVPLGTRALDHVNEKIDAAKLSGETVTVWLLDGTTAVYLGIILAVLLLFGVLYEALPTAKWGRTLGKKLCGLQVRDIEGGDPPSFGLALRRWLVYSVPGLLAIGVVGVLWGAFDRPWRQCWHDKAAHTFVAG
ncbi:RDD family protein [Streptomyces sp. NPDC057199]|uniref:RDD family protein n=1 Tax=Streptomyces sp. NPDC057199 TaxID=3346047 RepID=UPI00364308FA